MRRGRSDIVLLMVIMGLFGASVFFLQWRIAVRRADSTPAHRSIPFSYVSDLKIASELQPLLYTRSIGSIVGTFKKFDADTMCSTAHAVIFDNECPLTNEDRLSLLLALATTVSYSRPLQNRIFTILSEYYKKRGIEPLLLTAVRSEYAAVAADLLAWAERKQPVVARSWLQQAFKVAIDQGDVQSLEALYMRGARLTPEQATDCLWYIIKNNKSPNLISFFAKWGKGNINYIGPNGRSLIAQAAKQNNKSLVDALLYEGAFTRPMRIVHPQLARVPGGQDVFKKLLN